MKVALLALFNIKLCTHMYVFLMLLALFRCDVFSKAACIISYIMLLVLDSCKWLLNAGDPSIGGRFAFPN